MNKTELVGIIRTLVKEELNTLLKSKEGRAIVREMISKEVRLEVDKLLTEMEDSQGEVIEESKEETKLRRMVERGELPPKNVTKTQQSVPKLSLTKNKKLNAMLQDTLEQVVSGKAQLPSQLGADGQVALLKEQYANADEWKTMPGNFTSTGARGFSHETNPRVGEDTGKSVASMMPNVDVNGNPLVVRAVPDAVAKALTRDYRKLMKKVAEKRG